MLPHALLILLSLILVFTTSGCRKAPTPTITVPAHWPVNAYKSNKAADLARLRWWMQFHDPELNNLMRKTIQSNSELKIALARTEQAQSQLEQIKLSWLPGVNYLAGFSQFPNLGNPGAIAIAYPVYLVNLLQLYKQQQGAKAIYNASIYAQDGVKVALLARTAASYFIVCAQIEAKTLYQQLLDDQMAYLHALRTQFKAGLIAEDDVLLQNSRIELVRSQLDVVLYTIFSSKNALHYLLDENPGELRIATPFKQLNSNAWIPGNEPLSVLNNRPDVREAEALMRASRADSAAVKATLFPQLNLGAYLGTSGNQGQIKLGQALAYGPLIELPLVAQIKGAKVKDMEYYWRYRDTIKKALRDVANDMAAYTAYSTQLRTNLKAFSDAKKQCTRVQIRYKNGLENSLAPIKCAVHVDELALTINRNKLEQLLALVTLYQDLGGGYDES